MKNKQTYIVRFDYESDDELPDLNNPPFEYGCYVLECEIWGGETYVWAIDLTDKALEDLKKSYHQPLTIKYSGVYYDPKYPVIEINTGYFEMDLLPSGHDHTTPIFLNGSEFVL